MALPIILNNTTLEVAPNCKVLKASEYQQYQEAETLIDAAQTESENIIERAKAAYQSECERGYQEGLQKAQAEQVEHMVNVVGKTIDYLGSIEDTLADVLMSGVKKIINDFDDTALAVSLVKSGLQHIRNEKQVVVRIPPEQFDEVQQAMTEILQVYRGIGFVDVVPDPRLSAGECIMESDIGVIDTSVSVQLEALEAHFKKLKSLRARRREEEETPETE